MRRKKRKNNVGLFLHVARLERRGSSMHAELEEKHREIGTLRNQCESYRAMLSGLIRDHSRIRLSEEPGRYAIQVSVTSDMARCMRFDNRALGHILGDQIVREVLMRQPTFGSFIDKAFRDEP